MAQDVFDPSRAVQALQSSVLRLTQRVTELESDRDKLALRAPKVSGLVASLIGVPTLSRAQRVGRITYSGDFLVVNFTEPFADANQMVAFAVGNTQHAFIPLATTWTTTTLSICLLGTVAGTFATPASTWGGPTRCAFMVMGDLASGAKV